MTSRPRTNFALLVASIVTALPLWCARYLPFADLPEHEAASALLAHASDPAWRFSEHYTFSIRTTPYWLYDVLGALLTKLTGDAILAHRCLLSCAAILLPWAVASFLGSLGRQRVLGTLSAPLFWSKALQFGFAPFVAGIPVLFFGLAAFVATLRRPSSARACGALALGVTLALLHSVLFGLFVLSALALAIAWHRGKVRARFRIVTLVPFASALVTVPYLHAATHVQEGPVERLSIASAAFQMPAWTYDLWTGSLDDIASVVLWTGVLLLFRSGYASSRLHRGGYTLFLAWPFVFSLGLLLLAPSRQGAVFMLGLRLAPVVACAFLPLVRLARTREARVGLALGWVGVALTSMAAAHGVHAASSEVARFDRIVQALPVGSRVFAMNYDRNVGKVAQFPPWLHMNSVLVAERGGMTQYAFSSLSHFPLHELASPRKRTSFWFNKPCYFDEHDAAFYDAILVYGAYKLPEGSPFHLIASAPPFYLWAKGPVPALSDIDARLAENPCRAWGEPDVSPK